MNKMILLVSLFFCSTLCSYTQSEKYTALHVGPQLLITDYPTALGVVFSGEYQLGKHFTIIPNTSASFSSNQVHLGQGIQVREKFDFFSFSVPFRYYPGKNIGQGFSLAPTMGYFHIKDKLREIPDNVIIQGSIEETDRQFILGLGLAYTANLKNEYRVGIESGLFADVFGYGAANIPVRLTFGKSF